MEIYIYCFNDYLGRIEKTKKDRNGNKRYFLEIYKKDGYGNYRLIDKIKVFEHNTSQNAVEYIINEHYKEK